MFKQYFYTKTFHGDGCENEVWAHNATEPGEINTNCSAEMFHHTLRQDPDMFNGVQKPAYIHALGLLAVSVGFISFRVGMQSSVGGRLYTEDADTKQGTRVRNAWKAGLAMVDSGLLARTHKNPRGTTFWFLAGGRSVTREMVERLSSPQKGDSAAQYLAFFKLRRATVSDCQCIPFLKFGYCRHTFAINYYTNGMKNVPHGVRAGQAEDQDSDMDIPGDEPELGDDSQSDSGPDTDVEEEVVTAAGMTQRSRRPAAIYNALSF